MKRLLILSLFVFAAFNFANAQRKAGVSLRQIKDGETTSRGMLVMGAPGRDTLTVSFPRSWGPLNSAAPNSPMGNGEVSMYFVSADCGHGQIVDFERMWADSLNLENHIVFNGRAIALRRFTLPSGERVLAVDGIRNDDTIYYTMYYCIFEGRFVTASCIVAKKNNRDFQRAFEEYVPVFDAVFLSVKAERKQQTGSHSKKASAALREMQSGCVKTVESLIHRIDFKDVAVKYDIPESWECIDQGSLYSLPSFGTKDGAAGIYVHFSTPNSDSIGDRSYVSNFSEDPAFLDVYNGRVLTSRKVMMPSGRFAVAYSVHSGNRFYVSYEAVIDSMLVGGYCVVNAEKQSVFDDYIPIFDSILKTVRLEVRKQKTDMLSIDLGGGYGFSAVVPAHGRCGMVKDSPDTYYKYLEKGKLMTITWEKLNTANTYGYEDAIERGKVLERNMKIEYRIFPKGYYALIYDRGPKYILKWKGFRDITDGLSKVYELFGNGVKLTVSFACMDGLLPDFYKSMVENVINTIDMHAPESEKEEFSFDLDGKKCFSFTAPSKFNKRGYDEDTGKWFYVYLDWGVRIGLSYQNGLFVDFSDTANVKKRCDFFKTGGPAIEVSHKILPKGYHLFTIGNLSTEKTEIVNYELWKDDLRIRMYLWCMNGAKTADYESLMNDILNTFEIF